MPKDVMDRCEIYQYLPQDKLKLYEEVWNTVKTAD